MPTNTYVELDRVTVGSAVGSVTINMGSTISQAYTDLVLVIDGTVGSNCGVQLRFNGDSNSNYSFTRMTGDGSSAYSDRSSNATFMELGYYVSTARNMNILNIMNYSNSTTFKTVLNRASAQTVNIGAQAYVELWRSTAAITSITINASGNFSSGTTFSLYGIKAETIATAKATGGTITYGVDGYTYHTFTSSGTFTPSQALTCDYLVVAGGGGGGSSDYIMAGGGAGGLRSTVGATGGGGTLEPRISLGSGIGYTIQVGAGGPGNANGVNSFISGSGLTTITSIGGGYGAGPAPRGTVAQSGGSGGGGCESVSARGTGGAGTANQGYAGGNYTSNTHTRQAGGGGAGAVGGNSGISSAGNGGNGVQITAFANATITGANNGYYAGGGGGGEWGGSGNAAGGLGGGADGAPMSQSTGNSGVANTGGGGGGGANNGGTGGNGGSGIVIIRYASV